jgi:hypothetical protein
MKAYRKIGGGSVKIGNKLIKKNQTFKMDNDWEVPTAFADIIIPAEPVTRQRTRKAEPEQTDVENTEEETGESKEENPEETLSEYTKKERSPGWFDVVGADGKQINENALRAGDADELIKQWSE